MFYDDEQDREEKEVDDMVERLKSAGVWKYVLQPELIRSERVKKLIKEITEEE